MTLAEVFSKVLNHINNNDLGIYMTASVREISVDDDSLHVIFTDGNTEDWVITD